MTAIFALAAPAAYANTFVTNCYDTGSGSLRAAVGAAVEGDTVEFTGLTSSSPGCSASTITLTTGDIVVAQNNLTINGPGMTALNVKRPSGSHNRVFTHSGTGTLTIQHLTMSKGYVVSSTGTARGGCIYSKGNVYLIDATVALCSANTTSGTAKGGGIYTHGYLYAYHSTIGGNEVISGSTGHGYGGGAFSLGNFVADYSNIVGNLVVTAGNGAHGGGVEALGTIATIRGTTIAGNSSDNIAGGLDFYNRTGTLKLINSTISGNTAKGVVGGIFSYAQNSNIYNTTIAFNTAYYGSTNYAAGLHLGSPNGYGVRANLQSTLIANNTYGASPVVDSDIGTFGSVVITGSNNLVRSPGAASLPNDTIVGKCPLLGPLQNNGGPTRTHALLGHSPAIDAGNNTFGLFYDQRGSPFVRVSGPPGGTARADIGAYEVDQADEIFDANFEGCP